MNNSERHRKPKSFEPLSKTHPLLAAQWHPTKNGNVSPDEVWANYTKKFWWRCDKGHEWDEKIRRRAIEKHGCPFCSGRRVAPENSLAVKRPDLAAEWHPSKNNNLKASDVSLGSGRKIWWLCKKDSRHEWVAQVSARCTAGTGCPYCAGRRRSEGSSFATRFPHLIVEWHPTLNVHLDPKKMIANSQEEVWWQCLKDPSHVWKTQARSRITRDKGCPKCRLANPAPIVQVALDVFSPELASEWHDTKNGELKPSDVFAASSKSLFENSKKPNKNAEIAVLF